MAARKVAERWKVGPLGVRQDVENDERVGGLAAAIAAGTRQLGGTQRAE